MLDIDRFKDVNDRYGHEAGDAVLVCLADRLSQSFGRAHIVSRFGGEEFTVIAYGIHGDRAIRFFEDFRLLIENAEVRYGRELIRFTVSIGLFFGTNEPLDHMIREADRQLYRSKRDGRNRVMAGS
jgi:diguanylate cyclase (GGDEF)-like protein